MTKNYVLTISERGVLLKWVESPFEVPVHQALFSSVAQAMNFVRQLEKMLRSGDTASGITTAQIGQAPNKMG